MSFSTRKVGLELLRDSMLNKGSAFSEAERDAFSLHGLLPPRVSTLEMQTERAYEQVQHAQTPLGKYGVLAGLHDRNETLFYNVLCQHLQELMPIVYTPTVGAATQQFSRLYQRGRGVWITPDCRGRMEDILRAAAHEREVQLLVATDNEAILGIGDQGAGGMAISVGKLALYVAGAGIPPHATLPVSLDVGTDNQALLDDPLYLGWNQPRLRGEAYDAFIEEFVTAVAKVFPAALLQWEDFRKDNALTLMERYRSRLPSFNDDIQGTGAVALAGMLSAMRISGVPLDQQRVIIYGAGAAGLGIARQIREAFVEAGFSEAEARHHIAVLDSRGLLRADRERLDPYKQELAWEADFRPEVAGDLSAVIEAFEPTVLIGSSGQKGAFDESVVRAMAAAAERPLVMPFSNPTDCTEAVPEDILRWSDGRALIATGSPFDAVDFQGRRVEIGQGNNVFVFPGLGRGALACASAQVSDRMVTAAAKALARCVHDEELERGLLYPDVSRLREVSLHVADSVSRQAEEEGLATHGPQFETWNPVYRTYSLSQ